MLKPLPPYVPPENISADYWALIRLAWAQVAFWLHALRAIIPREGVCQSVPNQRLLAHYHLAQIVDMYLNL